MKKPEDMLLAMAMRQHELNCLSNGAGWIGMHRPWYRAIWVEAAELLQHYGTWEWWKKTETDFPQAKLEMVDIWHFGLSHMIDIRSSVDRAVVELSGAHDILPFPRSEDTDIRFVSAVEAMADDALNQHQFNHYYFFTAWACLGGTFEELYYTYMAKAILNEFRQKHGYKAGTYPKVWSGKEDNWYLVKIIEGLPADKRDDMAFATYVYEKLKEALYATGYGASPERVVAGLTKF